MQNLLAIVPLLVLLIGLLVVKWSASKAAAIAVLVAIAIAFFSFGLNAIGLSIAISKGMALALYVLLIIWAAVFLYHLVYEFKAIDVITQNVLLFIQDPFAQFLILAWLFSSVLQGIAGFGVPVIIVVPILIHLGFNRLSAVSAVLLGHSWAVSFGSMGSSFFTIALVTNLNQQYIGYAMGIFVSLAMIMMGFVVCYIYGGWLYVKKGIYYIIPTSLVMIGVMFLVITLNLVSLVGLITALSGLIVMFLLYYLKERPSKVTSLYKNKLTLFQALLPYLSIIVLSLTFPLLRLGRFNLSFRFPAFQTALGYVVDAESAYAKLLLFGHPAPIILISAIIALLVYRKVGVYQKNVFQKVVSDTITKNINTTYTLVFLIAMALVMMDSGMITVLAIQVATLTGGLYPLFAPLIGVLGSFITGSNTNSNVIFGKFQISVATALSVDPIIMAGVQSIAGSIGVSLGPTTMLMAASASGMTGEESQIYKKVIVPVLLTALLLGLLNYLLLVVLKLDLGGLL